MKDEQAGLLEEEILKEEDDTTGLEEQTNLQANNAQKQASKNLAKFLKSPSHAWKKPKIVTLLVLTLLVIFGYLALVLLSQKNPQQIPQSTVPTLASPSPKAPDDHQVAAVAKEVEKFGQSLESLGSDFGWLTPPVVDLEIKFQ